MLVKYYFLKKLKLTFKIFGIQLEKIGQIGSFQIGHR